MQTNKGNRFAFVLIALGGLILLSKFGNYFGSWLGYLFPLILLVLGYYGVKAGNSFFGWIFIIIGAISIISKLSGIISIIVAIAMIGYGVFMLGGKRNKNHPF